MEVTSATRIIATAKANETGVPVLASTVHAATSALTCICRVPIFAKYSCRLLSEQGKNCSAANAPCRNRMMIHMEKNDAGAKRRRPQANNSKATKKNGFCFLFKENFMTFW